MSTYFISAAMYTPVLCLILLVCAGSPPVSAGGLVLKLKGHLDHAHYIVQFGTFLYILSEQLRAGPRGDRLDRLGVMRVERICVL